MKTPLKKTHLLTGIALATFSLALAGCGDNPETSSAPADASPAVAEDSQLTEVFLTDAPEEPVSVGQARENAQPGDPITVKGRIAGGVQPFADDFALLMLVDETVQTCEQIPGDSCETPWDACCVPSEDIKAKRLTIQVLDDQGTPVAQTLKGANGLKELDTLIVQGTTDEASTPENLIINAEKIYRQES